MAENIDLITRTAEIASSFTSNNPTSTDELVGLIQSIYTALSTAGGPAELAPAGKPKPAVSIRRSIQPDFLVDLFTGERFKSLKCHIGASHQMTPAEYRAYWGLPSDYPMVAPGYSESRKVIAEASGLRRKAAPRHVETIQDIAAEPVTTDTTPPVAFAAPEGGRAQAVAETSVPEVIAPVRKARTLKLGFAG